MKVLRDLARRGNMRAIQEQAAHIETLGKQYDPFARKLRELAKGFEYRELMALVIQYMEKPDEKKTKSPLDRKTKSL